MLQFITKYPSTTPLPEQITRVVNAGCRWVELSAPGMDEAEMDAVAEEITPLCKETETFVVMRDHIKLAAKHRFHGIFLDYSANPRRVRDELGGEAIIGVGVSDITGIMDMRFVDIDYVVYPISADQKSLDDAIAVAVMAREKGFDKPIVAQGDFSLATMQQLRGAGFTGFALTDTLLEADDIDRLIATIQQEV